MHLFRSSIFLFAHNSVEFWGLLWSINNLGFLLLSRTEFLFRLWQCVPWWIDIRTLGVWRLWPLIIVNLVNDYHIIAFICYYVQISFSWYFRYPTYIFHIVLFEKAASRLRICFINTRKGQPWKTLHLHSWDICSWAGSKWKIKNHLKF